MANKAISVVAAMRIQAKRLAPLVRPQRGWLGLGLVFVGLTIALTLIYPAVIRVIIDEGIEQGHTQRVNQLALLMIAILLVEAPATYFRTYLFDVSGRRTIKQLQEKLQLVLLRQEIGFFDETRSGELNSRLIADSQQLAQLISLWLPRGIRQALLGAFAVALMIYTSPILSLLVLVVGPPIAVGTSVLGKKIQKRQAATQRALSIATATSLESFQGIRVVRAYDQEPAEARRFSENLETLLEAGNRQTRVSAALEAITALSSESAVVLAIWAGGTLIVSGLLTTGALVSFIFYTGLVVRSFRNLSNFFAAVMRSYGATERIFALLDREPQMDTTGRLRPAVAEGTIEFQDVTFRYPARSDVQTLRGVSFKIEPGQLVAVVGPSGSGKSTITSLMARMYDCDEGRILFDGRDIKELDPAWLRQHVTLVLQDSSLFSRTVGENILFGSSDAGCDEVAEAIEIARARDFIDALPHGVDTSVGDHGVMFSGGQRQRIAIARAVLRKGRILILDEATSALDSDGEALVKEGLRKLPHHPTVVIVAHRLSTVADADCVLVVANGRIAGSGKHNELLQTSRVYRELVENQLLTD